MFAMNSDCSDPHAKYILLTDIVPVDDCRYKFHNRLAPAVSTPTLALPCLSLRIEIFLVKMLRALYSTPHPATLSV